jgi:peptide/nickel transport system substrate-binding protein
MSRLVLLITGLVLVALSPASDAQPPSSVTVATVEWIEQFDPGVLASGPGLNYKGSMYDSVIGGNPDGSLSKTTGVVDNWTVSPDATQVTLRLRKGIKWHDGTEATAEDLAFTLTRFGADDGTASVRPTARKVAKLDIVDRYTLRVTLKEPDAVFEYGLSPFEGDLLFIKKSAYRRTEKGWELADPERPIGTGPYRFARRKIGDFVEYERLEMSPRSASQSLSLAHQVLIRFARPVPNSPEVAGLPAITA